MDFPLAGIFKSRLDVFLKYTFEFNQKLLDGLQGENSANFCSLQYAGGQVTSLATALVGRPTLVIMYPLLCYWQ